MWGGGGEGKHAGVPALFTGWREGATHSFCGYEGGGVAVDDQGAVEARVRRNSVQGGGDCATKESQWEGAAAVLLLSFEESKGMPSIRCVRMLCCNMRQLSDWVLITALMRARGPGVMP